MLACTAMCVPVLVAVVVLVILYLIVRIFYLRLLMRASKIVWLCVRESVCVCVCVGVGTWSHCDDDFTQIHILHLLNDSECQNSFTTLL